MKRLLVLAFFLSLPTPAWADCVHSDADGIRVTFFSPTDARPSRVQLYEPVEGGAECDYIPGGLILCPGWTGTYELDANGALHFSSSPDLVKAIVDAVIDAMDAHQTMSQHALSSKRVQERLRDVLLDPGRLYKALRERGNGQSERPT